MALKSEHQCTRCRKIVSVPVEDVKTLAAEEELDKKRAIVLKDFEEFVAGIDPKLLPDLFIVRRGEDNVVQTYLCNEEDAKRSCKARVDALVTECGTHDPRKPKTKKTPEKTE